MRKISLLVSGSLVLGGMWACSGSSTNSGSGGNGGLGGSGGTPSAGTAGQGVSGLGNAHGGATSEAGTSSGGSLNPGEGGEAGALGGAPTVAGTGGEAGAGEAGAPAASFSPDQLPGLALWLDASVGITANAAHAISGWTDRSVHHNDAAQITAANQPVLVNQVINGRPAIHFNGQLSDARLDIPDSASLRWGTGDFSLQIVAAYTNTLAATPRYGMLFGKFAELAPYTGVILFANYPSDPVYSGIGAQLDSNTQQLVSTTDNLNDGKPRLYGVRREGTTVTLQVNDTDGEVIRWDAPDDVSAPDRPVYIGSQPGIQDLIGDIAEIVAVSGTVSPADHAALTQYLMNKYAL
jgi:hypothetical protein